MDAEVRYKLAALILIALALIFWAMDRDIAAFLAFVVAAIVSRFAMTEEQKRK